MLGKLLKYDLKWTYKGVIVFYILAIMFSIIGRLLSEIENSLIFNIIGKVCIGMENKDKRGVRSREASPGPVIIMS